jgi:hypothetical protein
MSHVNHGSNSSTNVITFASEDYIEMASIQGSSVASKGFKSFTIYSPDDLDSKFVNFNYDTLNYKRGSGYWVWKPYIILQHLQKIREGEPLLYLDCGVLPRRREIFFQNLLSDDGVHLWTVEGENFRDWTEPKVLDRFKNDSSESFKGMAMAGMILSRNSKEFKEMMEQWLSWCQIPENLRPETMQNYLKSGGFHWHRHDQSLLNILVNLDLDSFRIHSLASDGYSYDHVFDIHRNLKLRSLHLIFSFPQLRILRHKFINKIPKKIRVALRTRRATKFKKFLTPDELKSISRNF